jgi:hypothetical protein
MSETILRLRRLLIWMAGLSFLLLAGMAIRPLAALSQINDITEPPFVKSRSSSLETGGAHPGPAGTSIEVTSAWNPYINAIPDSDGTSLFVGAGRIGEWSSTVYGTVDTGPTSHDRCHALAYKPSNETYGYPFEALFTPQVEVEGSITISTTTSISGTLFAGPVFYKRSYVPLTATTDLISSDGLFALHLEDHSLSVNGYTVILPTNAPPGPLPFNHTVIGSPYAIRASGSVTSTTQPGLLKMYYTPETLGDTDPKTINIYAWNPADSEWANLGGTLSERDSSLSVVTSRFTVYALMAPKGPIYQTFLPLVLK